MSRQGPHNTADSSPLLRWLWSNVNLRDQNGDAQRRGGVATGSNFNSRAAARERPAGNRRKTLKGSARQNMGRAGPLGARSFKVGIFIFSVGGRCATRRLWHR